MRICFIIEYYYPHVGGAEVLFQHLAEGLAKAGHSCDVVTCRLRGTKTDEEINGVRVHRVRVPRFGDRYWFTLLGIAASWKYARKADIIHTMTYNGALPAWIVSRLGKKPAVITAFEVIGRNWHAIGINPVAAVVYRVIERAVLRIPFDAYACISKSTMQALRAQGIPAEKMFLAYPGIDYDLFDPRRYTGDRTRIRGLLGLAEERFVFMFYGRPGFVKGVEHLVRAVPRVKEMVPGSTLLLILSKKPTSGRNRVMELVHSLGLRHGEDVIILDPVPREELPGYIMAGDCIVVPSLSEGFGFTCLEACTLHRPVVATSAGSLPEVIFGRYVLVEPGNANALADGIVRSHHGDHVRSEDKRFSWQAHIDVHLTAYHSFLRERNKP